VEKYVALVTETIEIQVNQSIGDEADAQFPSNVIYLNSYECVLVENTIFLEYEVSYYASFMILLISFHFVTTTIICF
jgi:hypothetical protein